MAEKRREPVPIPPPRTTRDWHIHNVSIDPEFIDALKAMELLEKVGEHEAVAVKRRELAEYFHISLAELGRLTIGKTLFLNQNEKTTSLKIKPGSRTATITLDVLDTTKNELLEQFSVIEAFREKIWKTKPRKLSAPYQPALVYAIFKARQHNSTYPRIYGMYKSGNLSGWTGSNATFTTPKMLENYYHRYKP